MTVLVRHDVGCKWGRFDGTVDERGMVLSGEVRPGHSDEAKRFADTYNLHKAAGARHGWIAVKYIDGSAPAVVYDTRQDAVADRFPWEDSYFYATLAGPASMTVCQAESLLRYKRVMSEMDRAHVDRDAPHGGLEVISRLTTEENEAQIAAVQAGANVAVPMGYRKG
jgi:hypothetical protein